MNSSCFKSIQNGLHRVLSVFMILSMVLGLFGQTANTVHAAGILQQSALVLVNAQSADYPDFQHFIQPYLDHFGIPYITLDISTTPVTTDVGEYALLVIGHRNLDSGTTRYLDSEEEGFISAAVNAGSGIVNFDNALSADGSTARYQFIADIFTFGYNNSTSGSDVTFADPATNYIIQNHTNGQTITTNSMKLAGITLPGDVTSLTSSGTQPLVAVTTYGLGRGVQFGSYDWISHSVKGPLFGLDDIFWRSMVWAARKPFVMQGLPPFVTMRIDDVSGPLWWIHAANDYGFVPWAGVFTSDIDATEAADLSSLVNSGKATTTIHAFDNGTSRFFYYDHNNSQNYSDPVVADNFAEATQWFASRNIPIGTYATPHYYEVGSNVFEELNTWGAKYLSTVMDPGQNESSAPWMMAGPFRLYETGAAYERSQNVYYADYMPTQPGFFNCITEIRDITGYEWLGGGRTSVPVAIADGTEWLKRPLDSMAIADLFSHEYTFIGSMSESDWRTVMAGIAQNISSYNPIYVSRDYACAYARAAHDSNITGGIYDPDAKRISVSLNGTTDMPTKFYVFREDSGQIVQQLVDVPTFSGTTQVDYNLPGPLDHISVSPNPADVIAGMTQQFTATGYDVENNPISGLPITWSVVNGGGTINGSGLFTAGITTGTYANTVKATSGLVNGLATVDVNATTIDHFAFDAITTPQYAGIPFDVTLRARDALNNIVVTYNGTATLSVSAGTVTPTTVTFTNGVWSGMVTIPTQGTGLTLTVQDGSATATSSVFDVIAPPTCPCTIWDETETPTNANESDANALQLGTKFRSGMNGYITGIRFYKGNLNTGTHTGQLYAMDGTLLASVVFTGETASGWQTAYFDTPVQVAAGTTYIASYHSSSGYYAQSVGYFGSAVNNPPLTALADGTDGPNGVYKYSSIPAFPTSTFSKTNYWVDVVFETSVGPDTTPPSVQSTAPANGASNVNATTTVTAKFNEAMDSATITSSNFELRDAANVLVPASVTYDLSTRTAILTPTNALSLLTVYTATVKTGVKDAAGNALATDYTWNFTTQAPPPDEGPGGPILVVTSTSDGFGRYYAEILRAEGLNEFTVTDIGNVNATILANYDVVILAHMALNEVRTTLFTDWVTAGGNLIAMRPDARLASLLGLTSDGTSLTDAYLMVNTASGPGVGIVNQTIQYHGSADRYTLNGTTVIATLYSNATTATTNPAVTIINVGSNGGQAAAFTFDLARSVVYTRQGNPAWQGINGDNSLGPVRSDDMFHNGTDPDWVNLDKVAIPQADEQQRLLANMIHGMNLDNKPLPRFWYFPRDEKAVVIMTADDHGAGAVVGRFDRFDQLSPTDCSVADWECIRSTGYIYNNSQITNVQALTYQNEGFEIAYHLDTSCSNWTPASLESMYTSQLSTFTSTFSSVPSPVTERTHCIAWSDWVTQPKVALNHGIRLDTNYYYWPPTWVNDRPGMFTGSGIPMRFADLDGSMIDVYQAATQLTDESGQTYPATIDTLLDRALSSEGYYGAFTANIHTDGGAQTTGSESVVASAQARSVPVVSAAQMLTWLDGRNNSSFSAIDLQNNVLSFHITAASGSNGLRAMLPIQSSNGPLTGITRNGSPVAYIIMTIKGVQYAFFDALTGDYQASYIPDTIAPAISGVAATVNLDGTVIVTWTTDELSTSRVDYGTVSGTLDLNASSAELVASHSITLTGLTAGTTYYFTVTSKDASNNSNASTESSFVPTRDSCPCSIWENAGIPTSSPVHDAWLIEVGTKFRSTSAGYVTSIRYYKGVGDTDTHVGHLWAANGAQLASVTFTNETASGWQEMELPTPVAISANTTYIVSIYSSPVGYFAITPGGLGAAVNNPPLKALASLEDGPNGVYRYGGGFPSEGNNANYWVDVVFDYDVDTTPPAISAVNAISGMGGTAIITWTTDEPANSRVDYGTNPDTLSQNITDSALVMSHSLQLSGLVPGKTYYYRVTSADAASNMATSPQTGNPSLRFTAVSDTTPPVISSISAIPGADGSASITWSTDEAAVSNVEYGTSADSLTLNANDAALVTSHTLTLTGLTPNTTYYYRVSSTDASNNTVIAPEPPAVPLTFMMPAIPLGDDTVSDFTAGTSSCSYVSAMSDGELILPPMTGAEFDGASLPSGWESAPWGLGGSAVVSDGKLTINNGFARTTSLYTPGHVLEYVATFSNQTISQSEHVGFAVDFNAPYFAAFSTKHPGGTNLWARSSTSGASVETDLGSSYLGSPHLYRVEWYADHILYFIDGTQVASHTITISSNMRPVASDGADVASLIVDWMHMSPFTGSCTFTSRVFDAGIPVNWQALHWTAGLPTGTSLAFSYRIGDTSTPDVAWLPFLDVSASEAPISGSARYAQYQVTLNTINANFTPDVQDVLFTYSTEQDTTAPTVTNRTPAIDAANVAVDSSISVTFSEVLASATVDGMTVYLRKAENIINVPATVTLAGNIVTLDPTASLAKGTTYTVTVKSGVSDMVGNLLGTDVVWSFTTIPDSATDTTVADFNLGTPGACVVDETVGNGAIRLPATIEEGFSGTTFPAEWASNSGNPWTGGTAVVSGGQMVVDGAIAGTTSTFTSGRYLEFVATFTADAYQHIGFVDSLAFNGPWAIFSTNNTSNQLYARTNPGVNIPIAGNWIGAPHLYRIEWTPSDVKFYIDGELVATNTTSISAPLAVVVSDLNLNTNGISVDSMRLSPFVSPCTFESRVLDAGQLAEWIDLSWDGASPTGTTVGFETRSGNTSTPDGSWSTWSNVNSPIVSPNGRYIQYRATLAGTVLEETPVIESVNLTYLPVTTTAPQAVDDTYTIAENEILTISAPGVLGNDTDAESDPITAIKLSDPASGTLTFNSDGSFIYTPAFNYHGAVSFTYKANDGALDGNVATVNITVTPNEYVLTTSAYGSGTVSKSPEKATYHSGDVVELTAIPAIGWVFTNWSGGVISTSDPVSVTINGNTTVAANFTQNEYTLTVVSAYGTVTKTPSQAKYHFGDVVTLGATPVAGWSFGYWSGDVTGPTNPINVTIIGDTTVTANYSQNEYTLTVVSAHGTVTKSPTQATYHLGDVVTLAATPSAGWSFTDWTPLLPDNKITINGNTTVTANYSQIDYTLNIPVVGNGSVTKNPEKAIYHYGDMVQLTALPAEGWKFESWSGDLNGAVNPARIVMTGSNTITANFSELPPTTLSCTTFNTLTPGTRIGDHTGWFDGGNGPAVISGVGLLNSIGLSGAANMYTWTDHPFTWSSLNVEDITFQQDFMTDESGEFYGDLVGWNISNNSVDPADIFGIQLGQSLGGIVTFWRNGSTTVQTPIAPLSALVPDTWHRLNVKFTKLTSTSAKIDVSLTQLDASGNPTGIPYAGTVDDTSTWSGGAPDVRYFAATSMWPVYVNGTTARMVGTGTPASCNEAALDDALAGGGLINFNCGTAPVTITITSTKTIASNTQIDGGGLVTISGGGLRRIFTVNSSAIFDISNLTIADGAVIDDVGGALYVNSSATVNITHSTFSNNSATDSAAPYTIGHGGAIYINSNANANINDSIFSGNQSNNGYGGAVYVNGGTLTVTDSTFASNDSDVENLGNYSLGGGAIQNNDGTITITGSTFAGNSVTSHTADGGAIYNGDFDSDTPDILSVTNSTFYNNTLVNDVDGSSGGAIRSNGILTLTHNTFSGNDSGVSQLGGSESGAVTIGNGSASLVNNIFANSFSFVPNPAPAFDCAARVAVGAPTGNLIEANFNCGTPLSTADPVIGALQDNGGPTQTMALGDSSPAINALTACAAGVVTDQRGAIRPQSTGCDIGAYEFDGIVPATTNTLSAPPADNACYGITTNQSPVITEGDLSNVVMSEDSTPIAFELTLHGIDLEGETLVWSISTPAANGSASVSGSGDSKAISYLPNANFAGNDSFIVQVADEGGRFDLITVNVEIQPVNDAPVITGQNPLSTNEDTAVAITLGVLNIEDVDNVYPTGFNLTVQSGANYSLSGNTVTPAHNFHGTLSIPVSVNDGGLESNIYILSLAVVDVLPTNAEANGPYNALAGQSITLNGSATCMPMDTCMFEWDLDGDAAYDDATGPSPVHMWDAAGDYTIGLRITDDDGNSVTDTASVHITMLTHSITLAPGWNLVSFNVRPTDTSVASVLSSIAGNYDLVYAWDATGAHASSGNWLKADNVPYSPDSLTALNETMGFWVHMTAADLLEIEGVIPATTNVPLFTGAGGWNLVGYPSSMNRPLPGALQDHGVGTDFSIIYTYHANETVDPWKLFDRNTPPFANDLTQLTPGWGYWIKVSADKTLNVNYITP